MQFLLLEQVQFLEVKDESLLQWELVNVLDAEEEVLEEGSQQDDDLDGDSVRNGFGSWDSPISSPNDAPIEGFHYRLYHPDAIVKVQHRHDVDDHQYLDDDVGHRFDDGNADGYDVGLVDDDDNEEEEEEEKDEDAGYDLDDELVPWDMSNKLGRQRMRKLGKQTFSKMHSSKRSPHLFVRPGCVRGKHGLGLKHNF